MYCACPPTASLLTFFVASSSPLLILESAKQVDHLVDWKQSLYAMKRPDGNATRPVRLNEAQQVLQRLAQRYWPGPMPIYMNAPSTRLPEELLVKAPFESTTMFAPLSCPSHPLTGRVLAEVHATQQDVVVIGTATTHTTARDVCTSSSSSTKSLHVLFGEDKRELFSVPTCHFGRQCGVSLWIDAHDKTVHICGDSREDMVHVSIPTIQNVLLGVSTDTRTRLIAAVLLKWKIVNHTV